MIFLIEYDRLAGRLVEMRAFAADDQQLANRARLELELARMNAKVDREIVTLEADSEEQVRRTHRRYFESFESLLNPDSPTDRKAA